MRKSNLRAAIITVAMFVPIQAFAITTRINTDTNGLEANNYSYINGYTMTPDSRFVVFGSYANNLVPNDNNGAMDIFVKDTNDGSIKAISSNINGDLGNNSSYLNGSTIVSPDGRYVIFNSYANNLVASATYGNNAVYIKDTLTDAIGHVSISYNGDDENSDSYAQSITPDGGLVLFQSYADNIVSGDTNGQSDVFVRDIVGGVTERISISSSGDEADNQSYPISITSNGRYVLFYSYATNLVPNDTNNQTDIFLYDRQNDTIMRVNTDENGIEANNYSDPVYTSKGMSDDTQYVTFYSDADNLVPNDTNGQSDVFLKNTFSGTIVLVSSSNSGEISNNYSYPIALAGSGRYVLFQSNASNLWSGNIYNDSHVYIKDMVSGLLELVDGDSNGEINPNGGSYGIDISPDGRYVLFQSSINDLVPNDNNGTWDIFIKDTVTGKISLVHSNSYGEIGNSSSNGNQISDDGRFALFQSSSNNLVDDDTNYQQDIFINEWQVLLMGKPTILFPTDESYLNINTVLVQGLAATGAQVEIDFSGTTYHTTGNSNDGTRSLSLPVLVDGLYTLNVRQKYSSDIVWSPYQTHTFTIDTTSPGAPTITTPLNEELIESRSIYIVGTGDADGTIRVQVGATTKVGSIDGLGNWNVGPFTILEGYKYAVQAQQTDIAGNQGIYSSIHAIYGVNVGVTTINPEDFKPDVVLTKNGISNGSTTGTNKDQNITYTLTYDNIGNAYASGTIIYETIPTNTCFTLGSISGLNDNHIIEYSSNYGAAYTYIPTGITGTQDCSITNIRVGFITPLAASTYVVTDEFNGNTQNTIANQLDGAMLSAIDGLRIIATGTIKNAVYGDINNDNLTDYITVSVDGLSSKYYIFSGDKYDTGTSWYTGTYAGYDPCYNNCASQLFLGDIDNDGWKDLILGQLGSGVSFFKNNGNGFDSPIHYAMTGAVYNIWGLIDLNNDGYQDMFSNAGYFMGSAAGFVGPYAGPLNPANGGGGYQVFPLFGDLNNDGNQDMVFQGRSAEARYVFNYGTGIGFSSGYRFNPARTSTYNGNSFIVDYDKDGRNDVILPYFNGTMFYYRNNKVGGFDTGYNIIPGGFNPSPQSLYAASIGDVNNDGFVDLVGGGLNQASKLFLGNGTGSVVSGGVVVGEYFAEMKPNLVDIDQDGDLDLSFVKFAGYGYPMLYFRWDENTNTYSSPTNWSNQQYNVSFIDINNDQYPDIMGSFGTTQMYMLNNTLGGTQDGITGTPFIHFFQASIASGTYTTILSSDGGISSWNKLMVGENTISGSNSITYTIYPVVNSICDTSNGSLVAGTQSNNGSIDISSITGVHTSICVEASLAIIQGVRGPILKTMLATRNTDNVPVFTFDVKVINGYFSGNTVTNTAYMISSTSENNTGNNISSHIFALPPQTTPSGGFGGGIGGNGGGGSTPSNGGGGTVIIKDLTPQEIADIIKEIDTTKPTTPVVVVPPRNTPPTSPVTSVEIHPTTPNIAIKEAIVQTTYVSVGSTVEVKTVSNPALGTEKKCYTPKEVVDITLGKNTTHKDQLVYQALLKSYDLTMFNNTDTYMPENGLKRYEAAKMFTNFAKHVLCRQATKIYNNEYTDIEGIDETLRPYIIQAYEYGILKGSKNEFRPLERISRKEFVAALMRMFTNENMDIQGMGNDWDKNYQEAFKAYGLDTIVGTDEEINRYAMSKIMYKLYYNTTYEWTDKGYVLPYGRD